VYLGRPVKGFSRQQLPELILLNFEILHLNTVESTTMSKIVIPETSTLYNRFAQLAQEARIVILVGLPGVGKSLYVQQMAVMAQHAGRKVHLLQWDVARPPFESGIYHEKYPLNDGETHAMIRKAIGLWTRNAIVNWHEAHPSDEHILVGEAPFVGERFMQLAKVYEDNTETLLASKKTQFILPVPSRRVRDVIEAKREKTIVNPQHPNEREDAPPGLLRQLWVAIYTIARESGFVDGIDDQPPYDPDVYRQVYEHLLRYRNSITLRIDEVFEPAGSVYELDDIAGHLKASAEEVTAIMEELEATSSIEQVQAEVDNWYR